MSIRRLLVLVGLVLLGACRAVWMAPPYIVNELAPTGSLRAAVDYGSAAPGVSIELAHELAWRLQVPLDVVPYDAAGQVSADAKKNVWDVAFFAIGAGRAEEVALSAPFAIIGGVGRAMATQQDRERSVEYLRKFVEEQKANGLVAAALARSGQKDATVAPPAKDR